MRTARTVPVPVQAKPFEYFASEKSRKGNFFDGLSPKTAGSIQDRIAGSFFGAALGDAIGVGISMTSVYYRERERERDVGIICVKII